MRLAFRRADISADSPPYLSLLKLHTPPFASKAGSAFFYADAERAQYLDMLQHLTQYSEELLLVSGDEGIGKSALIDKYLERVEEHWRVCRLDGGQGVDLDTLFARIAECFAVELGKVDVAQLLDALRQHLDALLGEQLSVLLIDDAHALSDDALEMVLHLAALEGEGGKLIRVLLFADSTIESRLGSPRFATISAPHQIRLKPMQEADSGAYLLHRLEQAGYSGASPFSTTDLAALHRQAQGVPAQLNQAAHALLLERTKSNGSHGAFSINSVRMGVAATALIGTVLGLHDRINEALGGENHSSVAMAAERPVLRLADSDNPWAVVIRDGENIQISCGNPTLQAEAVRPIPATLPLEEQAVMQAPLIKPVEAPPESEVAAKVAPEIAPVVMNEPLSSDPIVVAEAAVETAPTPAAAEETEPAGVEAEDSTTEAPAAPPLVIKPPIPSIIPPLPEGVEADAPADEEPPAEPEKLELTGVSPDPVIGSKKPQTIVVLGTGLEAGSKVAVGWSGKVKRLDASKVEVRDAGHMAITLTTGVEPAEWLVQLSTPSKQRSNVLRFKVVAPKPEPAESKPETLEAPAAPESKPPGIEKTEPKKEVAAEKSSTDKKARPKKGGKIRGSDWVAAQPAGNFTLQLLAASERRGLDEFIAAHPALKGPLGQFEQQRGDKRLQVVIQGSYPSRTEAAAAAKSLPDQLQPWIRDFAGIRKVMSAPRKAAATAEMTAIGGIQDTAWVWSQNPNHYTIQLAGAVDEASIEAVMRGLNLPGELAVVETLRNGKPWYALIYGRFADKAAAQGTAVRLPEKLKKAEPWIRRFSSLHDEIGKAGAR